MTVAETFVTYKNFAGNEIDVKAIDYSNGGDPKGPWAVAHFLVNGADGVKVDLATLLGTLHTDLGTLHADLGTAIGDLALVHADTGTLLHTDLGTLHTDLATTLAGKLDVLHTDLGIGVYIEDAATPADPVGRVVLGRRRDALTSEVSADGDFVTLNSTGKGELYTHDADLIAAVSAGVAAPTPAGVNMIGHVGGTEYETVAASQTAQVMGATGAVGDYLAGVLIIPATTAAGAVSITDGGGSAMTIFAGGGTTALSSLIPFFVPLGIKCTGAAWKITTGANVSAIGVGDFT